MLPGTTTAKAPSAPAAALRAAVRVAASRPCTPTVTIPSLPTLAHAAVLLPTATPAPATIANRIHLKASSHVDAASAVAATSAATTAATTATTTADAPLCNVPPMKEYRRAAQLAYARNHAHYLRFEALPPEQDVHLSARLYAHAAHLGCADSLVALALSHMHAVGLHRDHSAASQMLCNAEQRGSVAVFEARALCAITASFDPRCAYSDALAFLAEGIVRGSAPCLLWSGFCFEMGLGSAMDMSAARTAYTAARQSKALTATLTAAFPGALSAGDPWMLMKMALFFMHCHKRPKEAMQCLRQAASLGLNDAKLYLAVVHMQGVWLPRDMPTALHWLQAAAADYPSHFVARRLLTKMQR